MNPEQTRNPLPNVEPATDQPARQTADELLSHGLLGFLSLDKPDSQERRIGRVLRAIDDETAPVAYRLFTWRTWGALAATVAIVASLAYFGVPGETSGVATIQSSITAMQQVAGDRRFEIRTQGWSESQVSSDVRGTVDTRSPNLMLLKIPAPDNRTVTVGADSQGRWVIQPNGRIERDHPELAWPRFATIGNESLFADSVDKILDQMARFYTVTRLTSETLPGHGDISLEHMRGTKKPELRKPGPAVIDVWINPQSRIAERLQLTFDPPPAEDDPPMRGPGRPEGRPNGPRPEGAPNDAAPGDEHRDNDEGRPPGGPRDDRRPPPRPLGRPEGPGMGPDDDGPRPLPPFGPGGPGPRGPGMRGPGGPEDRLQGGPGARPHGPPHKVLRLDRVDPPHFADGWFSPETHLND